MSDLAPAHDERLPWVQPAWLAHATGWIRAQVEARGGTLTSEVEQPHAEWWSTVMRVPTSDGDLYADLQIGLARHAGQLLALGVPDERLAGIPQRVEQLLAERDVLRLDLPEGLTSEQHARLSAQLPELAAMCRELAAYGIPETLQHDDFHDGNVFVRDGRYVFFDWGDSCVSHPFHTLVVTLRSIAWKLDLDPGIAELHRLRDAYLEPFERFGPRIDLLAAFAVAYRVGTLARALAWHRFVSARGAEFSHEDAEAVPYGFRMFLAGGPVGSWR